MRGIALFFFLLSLPAIGFGIHWYNKSMDVAAAVEANIARANATFEDRGEPVSISYEGIETHGFPFQYGVRLIRPALTREMEGRTQQISMKALEITPMSIGTSRLKLDGEPVALASDTYQGHEFVYELSFNNLPSVAFRTPEEEKRYPENRKTFLGQGRITPPELLAQLPDEYVHQVSVQLPTQFTMTIKYGDKEGSRTYNFPKAPVRSWALIDYRISGDVEALFNLLTQIVHYGR